MLAHGKLLSALGSEASFRPLPRAAELRHGPGAAAARSSHLSLRTRGMAERANGDVHVTELADMARGREEPLPAGMSDLTGTHANLDLALLTAALLADEQDRPAAIVARGLVCRLPAHGEQDQG